jgi:hypothetical protein
MSGREGQGLKQREKSLPFGNGEGWQRDSPYGQSGVEARPVLQPRKLGSLRPGSGLKGQGTGAQSRVKGGATSLPARMWDWLSGDVPDAHSGRWPNKPLQGHRVAIVVVPVHKLVAGSPEG